MAPRRIAFGTLSLALSHRGRGEDQAARQPSATIEPNTLASAHWLFRSCRFFAVVGIGLSLFLSACSPTYVLRAGYEEAKILWNRRPIEQILQRPSLDIATREKLQLVLRVRQFAEQELGFRVGGSYSSLAEVLQPPLVHVITAAPRTQLEPYTWWFPIVGRVAYKGYFQEATARQEAQSLEAQGYDTATGKAIAFSTLGWFADPLLPHLLHYDQGTLTNVILHELFHSTFYLPGQTAFNESLANFAGYRGAIAFFSHEAGAEAEVTRQVRTSWESELALSGFFAESAEKLVTLYSSPLSEEEKLRQREGLFLRLQEEFRSLPSPVRRNTDFAALKLNNAVFLQQFVYIKELDLFERVYQQSGQGLRASLARIMEAAKSTDDPFVGVRALVAQ
ncbi:MAG: aminopeptidase [Deltaproteobacteria bacterium]|nr:aminopeptidase [Deltaproteobacteria bacterium]